MKKENRIECYNDIGRISRPLWSNSAEPEDENVPYIIGYKAEIKKEICIAWYSKKLIQLQHKSHT